ncbi:MAG: 4Fe-4S binding protein, partial [Bacteroidales bacterium]
QKLWHKSMLSQHGYCNYNCTLCSEVCPTQALKPLSVAEKKLTQVGIAQFRPELCIVPTQHADCGACAEHCPTQAVRMIPYKDGLTIPSLDQSLCIGCGGCEFICPVRPFQAIYVEGEFFHHTACAPADAELFEEKVDDFGF